MQRIVVMVTLGLIPAATAACQVRAGADEICEKQATCAGASGLDDMARKKLLSECRANLDVDDVELCAACVEARSCSEVAEGACSSDCAAR